MSAEVHTVARGESLESIAQKYNLTTAELIEANPGAEKLFYVGLKLNIPQASLNAPADKSDPQTNAQDSTPQNDSTPSTDSDVSADTDDNPGATYVMMLEYGFLPKTEGISSTNLAYAFTVGANYYVMHKDQGLFVGARIGYNSASYYSYTSDGRGHYVTSKTNSHFITLPINAGFAFATQDKKFAVTPYAAFDFNFCVAGKTKTTGRTDVNIDIDSNLKKKVGIDFRIGAQLRLWGFNVGGAYVIPLNKGQKGYFGEDGYFAVNIGYGF